MLEDKPLKYVITIVDKTWVIGRKEKNSDAYTAIESNSKKSIGNQIYFKGLIDWKQSDNDVKLIFSDDIDTLKILYVKE